MGGQRISKPKWYAFVSSVESGMPASTAATRVGIEYAAALRFMRADGNSSGHDVWLERCQGNPLWEDARNEQLRKVNAPALGSPPVPDPAGIIDLARLRPEAREAMSNGRLFRERYFGRVTVYWQDDAWDRLTTRIHECRATGDRAFIVMNMPPGGGKAGWVNEVIPTPTGWTTFGMVQVGDQVIAPDGTPTRVTFATEVMTSRPTYRVVFDDRTSVIVDGEHLWPVRSRDDRKRDRPARVLSTDDLRKRGLTGVDGRLSWSIDVQGGLDLPDAELPVPPYVLGAWLGDGHAAGARITKPAPELWEQIEAEGMVTAPSTNGRAAALGTRSVTFADGRSLQTTLRSLGVLGRKHIPIAYLRAGRQQMLDLLHGIMDTDGYVAADGGASLDLCDERLAWDVWHLLCALGMKVAAPRPEPAKIDGRQVGTRWRMSFTSHLPLGRTRRIIDRQKPARATTRRRFIKRIELCGMLDVRCIQVEHASHLFLAGRAFTPTHNTTLMHDLSCWAIALDRTVRIGQFSNVAGLAVKNNGRIRRSLERSTPPHPRPVDAARGTAQPAVATLAGDFGAFKPVNRDVWNQWAFVVAQPGDVMVTEKEATSSAFGFDQSYIGNRLDLIIADDMETRQTSRSIERADQRREDWDGETETRLEPGGVLILVGQRLGPDDLYAYAKSQVIPFDTDELEEMGLSEAPRRYEQIIYKAHDETKCEGVHARHVAQPWPEGCLLDPKRLPWAELKAKKPDDFAIIYQQEDSAPTAGLVDKAWVHGGVDRHGDVRPPAWDENRSIWQRPANLRGPSTGIITVDPSSTKWWAVQAWLYDEPEDELAARERAGFRHLLDLANVKIEAPELLGYNLETKQFYGILEQWRANYEAIGLRLHAVVVEQNHAQRFLLQYDHAKTWSRLRGVSFVPHNTAANKLDTETGVSTIGEHWRFGRVRLPGRTEADRIAVNDLVRQATIWPRGSLTDQVMANWFMEVQLPNIVTVSRRQPQQNQSQRRPSWLLSMAGRQ